MSPLGRREFLTGLGAAAAVGAGALSEAAQGPFFGKISDSTGRSLLTPNDLTYKGLFLVPNNSYYNAFAIRRVGGDIRFFIESGSESEVVEIDYPGYGPNVGAAPTAMLVHDWGDITDGRRLTANPATGVDFRSMQWDETYGGLWWTYGNGYPAYGYSDPSMGFTVMSGGFTKTYYGPWRTQIQSQMSRGYMTMLPSDWAAANTGGKRLCVGAPQTSINATSPVGPVLFACENVDPTMIPPNTVGNQPGVCSIGTTKLCFHDSATPLARLADYKVCGWNTPYVCGGGAWIVDGDPSWNNNGYRVDFCSGMTFVRTASKQGFLGCGGMVVNVPGYPYVTDNAPHLYYGPEGMNCCHGHTPGPYPGTGQKCETALGRLFFYDPDQFAQAYAGAISPSSMTPVIKDIRDYAGWAGPSLLNTTWQYTNAQYDETSRLLFIPDSQQVTGIGVYKPYIHVFEVAN